VRENYGSKIVEEYGGSQMAQVASKKKLAVVKAPKRYTTKKSPAVEAKPAVAAPEIKDMLGKVHALILTRPRLGIYRKVSSNSLDTGDTNPEWLGVRKKLFHSNTYRKIDHLRTEARLFVAHRSLPSYLKRGIYLIPKEREKIIRDRLTEIKSEMKVLIEQFVDEWEEIVEQSKKPLGKQFNKNDYPSKEEISRRFELRWDWITFDVPVDLDSELYAEQQQKAAQSWTEAKEVWKQLLRKEYLELVAHLVERLTPSKDGKKKVLRDSPFTNLTEWSKEFDPRNIQGDAELKAMVEQGNKLLAGANPDALREDEKARNNMRASFETIKNHVATMVALKPSRDVSFDEED
jgi:hypothetical protein